MSRKNGRRIGRPTTTSQEEILRVALQLLAEGGEAALSFRRLADRLGLSAPSLYTYFPSKQALLQALSDSALQLSAIPDVSDQPPLAGLRIVLNDLHQRLLQKQYLMFLFEEALPAVDVMELIEKLAAIIERGGIERGEAILHAQSLLWMTLGFVIFETGSDQDEVIGLFAGMARYADTLSHLALQQFGTLWQTTLERNLLFLERSE